MKTILLFVLMTFSAITFSQQTTVSDYVEGGKVLLEFAKLFKSEKTDKTELKDSCKKLKQSDIFFKNKYKGTIKINLVEKDNPVKVYETVIQVGKKESIYSIPAKVYICEVIDQSTIKVIKKGDIKLTPCENPIIKIK